MWQKKNTVFDSNWVPNLLYCVKKAMNNNVIKLNFAINKLQ